MRATPFASPVAAALAAVVLSACGADVGPAGLEGGQGVAVTIDPSSASLPPGGNLNFYATVTGTAAAATTVTWSVRESGGGSISSTGLYSAPGADGTFTVVATSTADPSVSGTATVTVGGGGGTPPDMAVLPADRRSSWRPGIPGGIPNVTTIHTTLNAATYGNGSTNAAAAINSAIVAAGNTARTTGQKQVVFLPAGTYRLNSSVELASDDVVLRGAGPNLTKLVFYGSGPVIWNGWATWPGSAVNITGTVAVGANTVTVASTSTFAVGDIVQIDQVDDPSYVYIFDAWYHKRAPGWNNNGPVSSGGYRSVSSMHEVTAVSGTTITFDPPVRIRYDAARTPQVWRVARPRDGGNAVQGVGIEDLYVTGGTNDMISLEATSYSWIRNVESDGSTTTGRGNTGAHISISHGFRNEVRRAYVHHATEIVQGGGAYGICLNASTSDTLVEDSIAVYLNKAVQTNTSGGGNVFAYNYIDNIRTGGVAWMEGAANGSHQAFSHHDLWEGNWATNIGSDTTHGNSGYLVYFRNFGAGRCADPGYFSAQTDNLRAANADGWMRETTFVGNVLHAHTITYGGRTLAPLYEIKSHLDQDQPHTIWRIGQNVRGDGGSWDSQTTTPPPNDAAPAGSAPNPTFTTKAFDKLWRHGNWDNVTNSVADWKSGYPTALPDSLYLSSKPAYFGSNPWPWVDPAGSTRLHVLPAKARYDAR